MGTRILLRVESICNCCGKRAAADLPIDEPDVMNNFEYLTDSIEGWVFDEGVCWCSDECRERYLHLQVKKG
jgi:hypothetical protein